MTDQSQISDLPFFDEYLNAVLRPRVEQALARVHETLKQAAWNELVRIIAQQQEGDVSDDSVRDLLEKKLGLQLIVDVSASVHGDNLAVTEHADVIDRADRSVEQVEVRRRGGGSGKPLVNAVLRGTHGAN